MKGTKYVVSYVAEGSYRGRVGNQFMNEANAVRKYVDLTNNPKTIWARLTVITIAEEYQRGPNA